MGRLRRAIPTMEDERAAARKREERGMVVFPTRRLYELEASTVQAQGVDGHR